MKAVLFVCTSYLLGKPIEAKALSVFRATHELVITEPISLLFANVLVGWLIGWLVGWLVG